MQIRNGVKSKIRLRLYSYYKKINNVCVCALFTVAVALIWLCVAVAISLCVLTVGLLVYRR